MRHRLFWLVTLTCTALLAAVSAGVSSASADTTQLTIIGPWQGQDAASFQAVLQGFEAAHPGITVTYKPVAGDVATALPTSGADLAVLSLPQDRSAMASLYHDGTIKSLDFAVPTLQKNYRWSWKLLGSTDGVLTGLFFKASDYSAFWYDTAAFKNLGLTPPTTWAGLRKVATKIRAAGLAPYAVSGDSAFALPNLFENVYLDFQGNRKYDQLASGALSWHDASVQSSLGVLRAMLSGNMAAGTSSLSHSYARAVRDVFGSPMKAYMVTGGSAVLPVLASSNADRPLSQFGVFAFPRLNKSAAPNVVGTADAVVMAHGSDAARSLIDYLATPAAAVIWAQRGGDFISPNMNVPASAYKVPQMATLGQAVSSASAFRFPLADAKPAPFRQTLSSQLARYLRTPTQVGDAVAHIALAAGEKR
jgi:alpha-glucoside transport system substrate-binding protein